MDTSKRGVSDKRDLTNRLAKALGRLLEGDFVAMAARRTEKFAVFGNPTLDVAGLLGYVVSGMRGQPFISAVLVDQDMKAVTANEAGESLVRDWKLVETLSRRGWPSDKPSFAYVTVTDGVGAVQPMGHSRRLHLICIPVNLPGAAVFRLFVGTDVSEEDTERILAFAASQEGVPTPTYVAKMMDRVVGTMGMSPAQVVERFSRPS